MENAVARSDDIDFGQSPAGFDPASAHWRPRYSSLRQNRFAFELSSCRYRILSNDSNVRLSRQTCLESQESGIAAGRRDCSKSESARSDNRLRPMDAHSGSGLGSSVANLQQNPCGFRLPCNFGFGRLEVRNSVKAGGTQTQRWRKQ